MSQLESPNGEFSIVLAKPIGGKSEFRFDSSYKLSCWIRDNRPDIFYRLPKNEADWDSFMKKKRKDGGYQMQWSKDAE